MGAFCWFEPNASFEAGPLFDNPLESEVTFKNFSEDCFSLSCLFADSRVDCALCGKCIMGNSLAGVRTPAA